ncbi:hypothetical protein, partial [Hydrotalea sp. AMD]|uniref:hypothetical protein n=1 Tax=Hydrotalea sp. AMD TaxID=2501297 RepID=UPI002580B1AC
KNSPKFARKQPHFSHFLANPNCQFQQQCLYSCGLYKYFRANYQSAVDQTKEKASDLGADSVVIFDSKQVIQGLDNYFLMNATALKCY